MKYLIQNKWWEINKDYNIDKILYLLIDRPERIIINMRLSWLKKNAGYEHRDYDLPVVVWADGDVFWYKIHLRHRENNKPTIIRNDGIKQYFTNGNFIKEEI